MAAQPLGKDHPTVARTYEMIEKAAKDPKNNLGKTFPDLYKKYLAAIRIPDYSINTEKSYLGWINRFLLFHNQTHPQHCAEPEVASFLEYLAVQRKVAGATQLPVPWKLPIKHICSIRHEPVQASLSAAKIR